MSAQNKPDVVALVAKYEAMVNERDRLREALKCARSEMLDVIEWARVERTALREQEIASIQRACNAARAALEPR